MGHDDPMSSAIGDTLRPPSGPVDLSAHGEASDVRLAVRDDGPLLTADDVRSVFDLLAPNRTSDPHAPGWPARPASLGLRLYIAREVVAAHGGRIDVTSSAAAGTLFTVHLPRQHPR